MLGDLLSLELAARAGADPTPVAVIEDLKDRLGRPEAASPMRAMVMAAGLGTRLRPITHEVPKPVVPVCNVAIVEHLVAAAGQPRRRAR